MAGRPCSICTHEQCREIEVSVTAGTPVRQAAKRWGVGEAALRRHLDQHLGADVIELGRVVKPLKDQLERELRPVRERRERSADVTIEGAKLMLTGMVAEALDTIRDVMGDPDVAAAARLKAAEMILDRAGVAARVEVAVERVDPEEMSELAAMAEQVRTRQVS